MVTHLRNGLESGDSTPGPRILSTDAAAIVQVKGWVIIAGIVDRSPFIRPTLAALVLTLAGFGAARAELCFDAVIDGTQQGTPSLATGVGKFVLSDNELTLTYKITFSGLSASETAAHIHSDAEGGVAVRDLALGSPKVGRWLSTDAQAMTPARVADLKAGLLYVNIHSTSYPAGEIKGQILPSACTETCYGAIINGENAGTQSPGTGFARLALNHTETELAYWVEFSGLILPETASHIHNAAEGGIAVRALGPGSPKAGVWKFTDSLPLTAARVQALKNGLFFVNIHSFLYQSGEIMGDVFADACDPKCFDAVLDAGPGSSSPAGGAGHFVLSHAHERVAYHYTVTGIVDESASHIHNQGEGDAVVVDTGVGQSKSGEWDYDDVPPFNIARVGHLKDGLMYADVHTSAYPSGEIRGQLVSVPCYATSADDVPVPRTTLHQNYPNPFNPATTISFDLAQPGHVRLDVFDVAGRRVATLVDGVRAAGLSRATWDGRDSHGQPVSSGVYFYRLMAGGTLQTKKMVLLK